MNVDRNVNVFLKEVEKILENYAKRITELEREKREKKWKIEEDREIELEKMYELLDELEEEYEEKKEMGREAIILKIDELAKKYDIKLDGDIFILEDEHTYASGMGFKHTSIYYLVCAIKLSKDRVLKVYANFTESDVYGKYDFVFNYTSLVEAPVIDPEKTPFSHELVRTIPWRFIRDTWMYNIEQMIKEIVEAEWKGNDVLRKTVQKVEDELKASSWIYDYAHVLGALREVREKFHI